jgi:hypothetical protein
MTVEEADFLDDPSMTWLLWTFEIITSDFRLSEKEFVITQFDIR